MNASRSPVAFGRFIITRRIARGGMAEIYRARTRSTAGQAARWVAIKMMRSTLGHEELRERLFEREVRIATRLHHPNIVPVYEFGQELGRPFLAMEYVRGRDLAALLKPQGGDRKPVPFELGLYIGLLASRGLGHAHRLRDEDTQERLDIVHRDMSPGNVIVGYDGTVKVLDFGVARINETQGYQTQTGTLRGKFAYMSPEQTLGEELDARSDVFSFGTVLYELLTGTNCFRASSPIETLEKVQGLRPVPPSRAVKSIPKDVDRVLAQCLSKDKRRRFPDGLAVSEAIGEYLDKLGYDGRQALIDHMASTFSWEQHEEASELAREQEEVALMEVVDFVPDLTNDGLDSKHIAVSMQEEASSADVRHLTVHHHNAAGEAVFDEDSPAESSGEPAATGDPDAEKTGRRPAPGDVLSDDQPLGRGQAVEAASLLNPAGALGVAVPGSWNEDDSQPTAHVATGQVDEPLPPTKTGPWYRGPTALAALATAAILLVSWVLVGLSDGGGAQGERITPTIAPVTIRLSEEKGERADRRRRTKRKIAAVETPRARERKPATKVTRRPAKSRPSRSKVRARRRRPRTKKAVTGYLNVGARPWAEITIDGKRWPYQTPQAGIELPVGKHVVVLHNPTTGVTRRTAVYIKHGKYKTVNLDLRRR